VIAATAIAPVRAPPAIEKFPKIPVTVAGHAAVRSGFSCVVYLLAKMYTPTRCRGAIGDDQFRYAVMTAACSSPPFRSLLVECGVDLVHCRRSAGRWRSSANRPHAVHLFHVEVVPANATRYQLVAVGFAYFSSPFNSSFFRWDLNREVPVRLTPATASYGSQSRPKHASL
jgi:hypothetical protein